MRDLREIFVFIPYKLKTALKYAAIYSKILAGRFSFESGYKARLPSLSQVPRKISSVAL